ncbi:MAG: filamentous hemagglutinin N-terminal domain-containing protein [Sterolibacterium sp.]|nr:filamentous hemagglutinin N-terminal domain-containing protein [Sterolibacterium sp.]
MNKSMSALSTQPRRLAVAIAAACLVNLNVALAMPSGAQIAAGSAQFNPAGAVLNIHNSDRAILNWQSFNIGANETVRFHQASASSSVLNRVLGNDPSQLLGQLQSNGRVWLINPAGILVGAGARIDTAGFVASTLNVRNEDFLAGKLNFQPTASAGGVINRGSISTPEGGSVYLVAPDVKNEGLINTPKGETLLAAGQRVDLIDTATPGVSVEVTGATGNVTNLGQVVAEAGRIGMVGVLVKNSGTLDTHSVVHEGGRIFLKAKQDTTVEQQARLDASGRIGGHVEVMGQQVALADQTQINASGAQGGGTVLIGGDRQGRNPAVQNARALYVGPETSIQADALQTGDGGKVILWSDEATRAHGAISTQGSPGGQGGFIETSGGWLSVNGSRVRAGKGGEWLLDPYDIVITSTTTANNSGTPLFTPTGTSSIINNSEIATALASASVTIDTTGAGAEAGNISVMEPIAKTAGADATLTLRAHGNITVDVNGAISSSAAKLNVVFQADQDNNTSGTVTVVQAIDTNGGNFTASGNVVNLNSTVTATGALVWLYPNITNAGMTIVGTKTGGFQLTTAELNNVTASTLRIGDMNSGALAINAPINPTNVGTLSLRTGSTILQSAPITITNLAVQALDNVTLTNAGNQVGNLAASIGDGSNQNKNFSYTNNNTALQVAANIDGLSGIQINTSGTFNAASPDGVITLVSGGVLTQLGSTATLGGKAVYAEGTKVTLGEANPTGVIAGKATGAGTGDIFSYKSSNPIQLSTVATKSGVIVSANYSDAYTVELEAGSGGIGQDSGALVAPTSSRGLKVKTTGPVNLTEANTFGQFATTGSTGQINLKAANALTLGSNGGDTVTTSNAALNAETTLGDIIFAGNVNTGTGSMVVKAANLQIGMPSYAGVTLTGGDIKLTVNSAGGTITTEGSSASTINSSSYLRLGTDNFSFIQAPSFSASTAIYYRTFTDNRSITVGSSCNGADPTCLIVGGMTQSAANIIIGNHTAADNDTTGNIHVDAALSNGSGRVFLLSGAAIDQAAAITANGLGVIAGSNATLNTTNALNNVTAQAGGTFALTNGQSLTVNSVSAQDAIPAITGVSASGAVQIHATGSSNLTLSNPVSSALASGNAVILDAAGSFTNSAGASGITLSGASAPRWLVYAASPANTSKGGLTSNFRHYSKTYATYPGPVESGKGYIYASAPGTLTVNTTLASGVASNTYGTAPTATYSTSYANAASADNEDLALIGGTASYTPAITSSTAAGTYTILYGSGLTSAAGYSFTAGSGVSYTVDPALLAVITAGLTGDTTKVYDGTTTAALKPAHFLLSGFMNGDNAHVTQTTGTYASKQVGSNLLVTATLAPADFSPEGSTNLANYQLPTSASGQIGTITPATLSMSGVLAKDKVYDAKTAAQIDTSSAALNGIITGDTVHLLNTEGHFADKNVGQAKPVSLNATLEGGDAGNYVLQMPANLAASITPAPISQITGITANDKVYDATTVAQLDTRHAVLVGQFAGDDLSMTGAQGAFADKNVGKDKPVNISGITLSGTDAGNYRLESTQASTLASIQPLIDDLLTTEAARTGMQQAVDAVIALTTTTPGAMGTTGAPANQAAGGRSGGGSNQNDEDTRQGREAGAANDEGGAANRPATRRLPMCS